MSDKEKLNDMLDDLINSKPEQAQINFHDYLQTKMREIVVDQDLDRSADQTQNEE
jgi:hypothetical protein